MRHSAVAAAAALVLAPQAAAAEGNRPDWAFGEIAGEVGTAAFTAATNFTYLLPQRQSTWGAWSFRPHEPVSAEVSDMFGALGGSALQLGAGYLFEAGYLAMVSDDDPGVGALFGAAVDAESVALASGVTAFMKRMSGRCRPRAYAVPEKCTAFDAFPSGHTSSIAAFAGARVVRTALTPWNDAAPLRLGSLAFAEASMLTAGILRVVSGSHSWDDVLVGALIGHAAGITVALIHPTKDVGPDAITAAQPLEPSGPRFSYGGTF